MLISSRMPNTARWYNNTTSVFLQKANHNKNGFSPFLWHPIVISGIYFTFSQTCKSRCLHRLNGCLYSLSSQSREQGLRKYLWGKSSSLWPLKLDKLDFMNSEMRKVLYLNSYTYFLGQSRYDTQSNG